MTDSSEFVAHSMQHCNQHYTEAREVSTIRPLSRAAIVTALLAAAFPVMADDPQQAAPTAASRPMPAAAAATDPVSSSNDPTVASPELRRELFRLTVSQIRAACPGATTEFILKQLEAQTPLDKLRDEWASQQAATIEKLKTDRTNNLSDTIARLKEACPGAPDAFVMEKLVAGSTVDAARTDWMKRMTARVAMLEANSKTQVADSIKKAREQCPGASTDFLLDQLSKGATPEQMQAAWMIQRLELLQANSASVIKTTPGRATPSNVPQITIRSRIIPESGKGIATVLIDGEKYELRQDADVTVYSSGRPVKGHVEEVSLERVVVKFESSEVPAIAQ